jgi:hypothetical protein
MEPKQDLLVFLSMDKMDCYKLELSSVTDTSDQDFNLQVWFFNSVIISAVLGS